jgi:hypothetical protein
MKAFVKALVGRLSPSALDVVAGIGTAFDPIPRCYHETFESDADAFGTDAEALYRDWLHVYYVISTPTQHMTRRRSDRVGTSLDVAIWQRAFEREREHA